MANSELWRAKGCSIFLISPELRSRITPVARTLSRECPGLYPVTDGHVTLVGNIPSDQENVAIDIVRRLNPDLSSEPMTLHFLRIDGNPNLPSQTLFLEASFHPRFFGMLCAARNELGLDIPSKTLIHASVVYNQSPCLPADDDFITSTGQLRIAEFTMPPFSVRFDRAIAVRTQGTPQQWQVLS